MIKDKIQEDFIAAMKSKDVVAKLALSGIKAKIIESEKEAGRDPLVPLSDDEVIKIVTKAVRQRDDSAKLYVEQNRQDLADAELAEAEVLRNYLPAMMTDEEIEDAIKMIAAEFASLPNENARRGKTAGEFNKRFMGRADLQKVKDIIAKTV